VKEETFVSDLPVTFALMTINIICHPAWRDGGLPTG
jgi:hypothetical protein